MPYLSADSLIESQQLKVQELVIRFADVGLYSASGAVVTVNLQETVSASVSAEHFDDSIPSLVMVTAANRAVSSTSIAITLANAFATNDVLVIRYIVKNP